jgi:hypothetical protein
MSEALMEYFKNFCEQMTEKRICIRKPVKPLPAGRNRRKVVKK